MGLARKIFHKSNGKKIATAIGFIILGAVALILILNTGIILLALPAFLAFLDASFNTITIENTGSSKLKITKIVMVTISLVGLLLSLVAGAIFVSVILSA